jgi:hypothetical protein
LEIFLFPLYFSEIGKNIYAELVASKWHSGPGPLNIGKTAASTSGPAGGILKRGQLRIQRRQHCKKGRAHFLAQEGAA